MRITEIISTPDLVIGIDKKTGKTFLLSRWKYGGEFEWKEITEYKTPKVNRGMTPVPN